MTGSAIREFLRGQARRRRGDLISAAMAGGAAAAATTLMLGLSGWFLAGAALAGLAGPVAVQGFNYLLPSAGLRAFAILRTAGRYGERLFAHRAALFALAALRPALFAGIAAAPPQRSLALSSGEASARLVQDVSAVETLFVRRPAVWVAAGATVAAMAATAFAAPTASATFLAGAFLLVVALRRLSLRLTQTPSAQWQADAGRLKDTLAAYAQAADELSCFGLTDRAVLAVMECDRRLSHSTVLRRDAEALLDLAEAAMVATIVALVAVLSHAASLPLAALAALSTLAGLEGLAGVVRAAREEGAADAAIARLDETIASATAPEGPAAMPEGRLRINGIELAPGERVALLGPSGCGKTSLLEALIGLRTPAANRLQIDGRLIKAGEPGWSRRLFAYAPQDARLLTGTVAENLRLGAPDMGDDALWDALTDAALRERIERLPKQLDTWIGDGGEILSGGERRRLSLARALVRPATWLLLDEPTEGLDPQTEAAVVQALSRRLARTGQGLILVSHRTEPLRMAQRRIAVTRDQQEGRRRAT